MVMDRLAHIGINPYGRDSKEYSRGGRFLYFGKISKSHKINQPITCKLNPAVVV
jgi:hypothetical protein